MSTHNKISETAARWFIRMQEASPDAPERSQFEAWLMQSPLHQQEYLSISHAWQGIDSVSELQSLAQAKQTDVFLKQNERKKTRQKLAGTVAGVVAAICIGWAGFHQYQVWQNTPMLQLASTTARAQLMTQTLDDGSRVTLNANSHIEIKFYRHQRHIDLLQGEAVFEVQQDPDRPFVVETNRLKVTVLGTRFAINKLQQLERISVDHGKVEVISKTGGTKIILHNNQVAELTAAGLQPRTNVTAQDYFKFISSTLVFNQAELAEIAETLSRYRPTPVTTDGLSKEKISAVVAIKDSNNFISTLPRIANIHIKQTTTGTLLETDQPSK
ncbi:MULTISPECIES: FecR domain-containing protein [unclassified Methylophilus]|uniref:FecR family protein n=1 Tax=unclassified Methylophilus TaxID=2630143 RepID=UPI00037A9494|nr:MULTISPECIES: FecR domain-containing protein [unclassified Methylophilus]